MTNKSSACFASSVLSTPQAVRSFRAVCICGTQFITPRVMSDNLDIKTLKWTHKLAAKQAWSLHRPANFKSTTEGHDTFLTYSIIKARFKSIQFVTATVKNCTHSIHITSHKPHTYIWLMLSGGLSILCIHTHTHTHTHTHAHTHISSQIILQFINVQCLLRHDFQ